MGIDLRHNFLKKLYHTFFFSESEHRSYEYFKTRKKRLENSKLILVQSVEDLAYYSLFGSIVNTLNAKENIYVEQYIQRNLTLGATSDIGSFLKSIFLNNRLRDNKWIRLYASFSDGLAYRHEGSSSLLFDIKAFIKAYKIYSNIESKEELLTLVVEEIKVGDLIYDSYLRFKSAPTVDVNDFYLCIVLWQTMRNIEMTNKYFDQKKPSILLTSYSTYIQHGIAVRIAVKKGTKVYSFGNYQSFSKELKLEDVYHTANYSKYKEQFLKLEEQEQCLGLSRDALESRLNGGIDTATAYMKKSAYVVSEIDVPNVKGSIIVFLHDFFDSPHIYGNMVFPDFLEWIEFTIKVFEKNNISYFLKPHPNQIGDSQKVIDGLKLKYPNARFLSTKITNKQLVNAGMCVGISVYGTVAHELVYMGIPVIMVAQNPHSSYGFCFEAEDKEQYEKLIRRYKTLKLIKNVKSEVESFYYMHNVKPQEMQLLINSVLELYTFDFSKYQDIELDTLLKKIQNNKAFKDFIQTLVQIKG